MFLISGDNEPTIDQINQNEYKIVKTLRAIDSGESLSYKSPDLSGVENIECSKDTSGRRSCSISPFVGISGSKVITADQMEVSYSDAGEISLAQNKAKNLVVETVDPAKGAKKQRTLANEATVGIAYNNGLVLSVDASSLKHQVSSAESPESWKDQLVVKGDTKASLRFDADKRLNIGLKASTSAGIHYESDPFSNDGIKVHTNSGLEASFNMTGDQQNVNGRFELVIGEKDLEGNSSYTNIREENGRKVRQVEALGRTAIAVSRSANQDTTGFEIASDDLKIFSQKKDGKYTAIHLQGLKAEGEIKDKKGNAQANVQSKEFAMSRKKYDTGAQDMLLSFREDDEQKKYHLIADKAYYNNGKVEATFTEGVDITSIEYKDTSRAPKIGGKEVESDSYMFGTVGEVKRGENIFKVNGKTFIREVELVDGGEILAVSGESANYIDPNYRVNVDQDYTIVHREDHAGEESTYISANAASFQSENNAGNVSGFMSTRAAIGEGTKGEKVYMLESSVDKFVISDQKKGTSTTGTGLKLAHVEDEGSHYGILSANEIKHIDNKNNLNISGLSAVFYNQEQSGGTEINQGAVSLDKLNFKNTDVSYDLVVAGENGEQQKVKIFILENGDEKQYKVFNEQGNRLSLTSISDKAVTKAIFDSIEFFEGPKGREFIATNFEGRVQEVGKNSDQLRTFRTAKIQGIESLKDNFKAYTIVNGELHEERPTSYTELDFESAYYQEGGDSKLLNLSNVNGTYSSTEKKEPRVLSIDVADISIIDSGQNGPRQGVLSSGQIIVESPSSQTQLLVEDLIYKKSESNEIIQSNIETLEHSSGDNTVSASGVTVNAHRNNDETITRISINQIEAVDKKAVYKLRVTDEEGVARSLTVLSLETSDGKYIKLFNEDGSPLSLDVEEQAQIKSQIKFDSLESFSNEEEEQQILTRVNGQVQEINKEDPSLYVFDLESLSYLRNDDSKLMRAMQGEISQTTKKDSIQGEFQSLFYRQQNEVGVDEKIKELHVQGLDLVAIDTERLQEVSGNIAEVNFIDSKEMKIIDINDLNNFKYSDQSKNLRLDLEAGKAVQVQKKNSSGEVISSYFLVSEASLEVQDLENGVDAKVKAGILEVLQDRKNDQNIILNADINGKVRVNKKKSPINSEVNFSLKGKNLTTESESLVTDNGATVSKYFAINTVGAEGKLDHLKLSAGPKFLSDAILIEAKGGESGGKKLSFEFLQDKENGTYFIRTKFIEGEKVKVKLFPFTLESKLEGGEALAEILITPKGQNYLNHLEIITNVVSANEITDWLGVSDGGMLIAKSGTLGGFGVEMMYQDHNRIDPRSEYLQIQQGDVAATYGAGIYHENNDGDRTSVGVMLSGDSEFSYSTNGAGVLRVFGQRMNREGRLPATLNLYFKRNYAHGDALYAGVHADLASFAIDESKLSKDSEFFDGGRQAGKLGATVGYSKKLKNDGRLSIALGANNDFQDPAVCLSYSAPIGTSEESVSLASASMDIVNRLADKQEFQRRDTGMMGPTLQAALISAQDDLQFLEREYDQVKTIEETKRKLVVTLGKVQEGEEEARVLNESFSFSEEDFKNLANLVRKGVIRKSTLESLSIIHEKLSVDAYFNRRTRVLDVHSIQARAALKNITEAFQRESSAEVHKKYLDKLSELRELQ